MLTDITTQDDCDELVRLLQTVPGTRVEAPVDDLSITSIAGGTRCILQEPVEGEVGGRETVYEDLGLAVRRFYELRHQLVGE